MNFYIIFKFLKRGRSPVGGDCYHTIINPIFKIKSWFFFISNIGAMAIAPYGFSDIKTISEKFNFIPILLNGALENSTLRAFKETP